jgi:hypothetical protein
MAGSFFGRFGRARVVALVWAILVTAVLAVLIVIGSRRLTHFDAALVGYTFATLFAVFGITYRYAMWLQRPPTRKYWVRGWQAFFAPRYFFRNVGRWVARVVGEFAANGFIFRRGRSRGLAHLLIMWGCIIAGAITFPLVFGWIHFETVPGDLESYRTYVFGFATTSFRVHSVVAVLIFHGLVWSAILVVAGVMLAMRRRMRDHGAAALQRYAEDFLPLILLFAISITGLMLTASYTWMKGYGYDFLALLHAVTVIFTLLWLPFGKFFHVFQRPAQLGVGFYREVSSMEAMARCARCGAEYAPLAQVEDLIAVERELGYRYELAPGAGGADEATHYQRVCPACRRALVGIAQGELWQASGGV